MDITGGVPKGPYADQHKNAGVQCTSAGVTKIDLEPVILEACDKQVDYIDKTTIDKSYPKGSHKRIILWI
jgi:hypothetical protein